MITLAPLLRCAAPLLIGVLQAPAPRPSRHTIEIKNFIFAPAVDTVRVGDTVAWRNGDILPHTVTGGRLESGSIGPGRSWRQMMRRRGVIEYHCRFHPTMHGTLVVR